MSRPRKNTRLTKSSYPNISKSKLGLTTWSILNIVGDAHRPVPIETLVTNVATTIHPSVAHRVYVKDVERQRRRARAKGFGKIQKASTDPTEMIRLGRRRITKTAIQNMVNTGRLARVEVDGDQALVAGPRLADLLDDTTGRLYFIEYAFADIHIKFVTELTPPELEVFRENEGEGAMLRIIPVEWYSKDDAARMIGFELPVYSTHETSSRDAATPPVSGTAPSG